jgi:type II secretion system protein C
MTMAQIFLGILTAAGLILFPSASAFAKEPGVKMLSKNNYVLQRSYVTKKTANLSDLLMQVRMVPVKKENSEKVYGYRLIEIESPSLYRDLGFEQNDIVTEVNGKKITTGNNTMELYAVLDGKSKTIKVKIERAGRNQEMNYRIAN